MSHRIIQLFFFKLLLTLPMIVFAQNKEGAVNIINTEVHDKTENEKHLGYRNSGIWIKQNTEGIIFKSHLHSYEEISVQLINPEGKMLYEYKGEMKKLVNYNISLSGMPTGRYILNFIYEEMLVVCNVYIE